jgi:hypothetical protein
MRLFSIFGGFMGFREYAKHRLAEDLGLSIDSLRGMILKALGGNADNKDAYNSPLTQFAEPTELVQRLYSLKGLEQLISANPAALQALEKAQQTNLTVGELAGILLSSQPQGQA